MLMFHCDKVTDGSMPALRVGRCFGPSFNACDLNVDFLVLVVVKFSAVSFLFLGQLQLCNKKRDLCPRPHRA